MFDSYEKPETISWNISYFLIQSELKLRLIKLNWQKSMCTRVKTTDEQAKTDVKVQKTCCSQLLSLHICKVPEWCISVSWIYNLFLWTQLKKQALKEKMEDDVGALVQFLLDEKDDLLERLEAEATTTIGLIDENLKRVESEAAKVDKAITEIQKHLSDGANFEVKNWAHFNIISV